jgi:hypothetical protein
MPEMIMSIKNKVALLMAVLLLVWITGCVGRGQIEDITELSPDVIDRMFDIDLIDNPGDLDYVSLGELKGLSCVGGLYPGGPYPTEEDAIRQLKIRAARLYANAILNLTCTESIADFSNNCGRSWVCTGEAIDINY